MNKDDIIKALKLSGIMNPTEQDILNYIQNLTSFGGMPQELVGATPIDPIMPIQTDINTGITPPKSARDILNSIKSESNNLATDNSLPFQSDITSKIIKEQFKQYLPSQAQLIGAANLGGQSLLRAGITNQNTKAGIIGGAMQGAVSGFKIGGTGGGILGGLLGGTMGYASVKEQQTALDMQRQQEERARMLANSVSPTLYADGGEIMDGAGNVGIQTELGERMVLPNGDIVVVKADELHKDMSKDKVTDFVPEGTIVFSTKTDKKNAINPKDYKDEIMGYSVVHYDENDPNSSKLEEIKFGDIIGDKPISPSEALEMIRKKYKTVPDDRQDIFSEATNKENKKARMPYISALAIEQARNNGDLKTMPQQFGYGGGVRVRKYPDGGGIYPNSRFSLLSGKYNIPNYAVNYSPLSQIGIPLYDSQDNSAIDYMSANLPYNTYGAYGVVNSNGEPTLDNQGFIPKYGLPSDNYFKGEVSTMTNISNNLPNSSIDDPYAGITQIPPDAGEEYFTNDPYYGITQIPPDAGEEYFINKRGVVPLNPLPTIPLPNQIASSMPNSATAPQNTTGTNPSDNPYAIREAEVAAARANANVSNIYNSLYPRLDQLENLNQQSYAQNVANINKNIGLKTGIAGATALNEMITTGMQNPMVYARLQTPYLMNEQYRNISQSNLDRQVSQLRANTNMIIAQFAAQGRPISEAAPLLEASQEKESQLRSQFYNQQNQLDRAKYTALATMRNANDAEMARVQQQTLANQNAITGRLGAATQNWLSQTDTINDNAYTMAQKALQNYTTNEQTLFNNRLNVVNNEQIVKRHYAEKLNEELNRLKANNERKQQMKEEERIKAIKKERMANPVNILNPLPLINQRQKEMPNPQQLYNIMFNK